MYIGIDIGGMSIKAGIVDQNGNIIIKQVISTGPRRPMKKIVEDIGLLVNHIIIDSKIDKSAIKSIGIGVPGISDSDAGKIIYCDNINLDFAPVGDEIHKYLDAPVFTNNDANVAALAEYYNLDEQGNCFIAVTLGTGVGGGIILNGQIFSGSNGVAGELGHIVINENGEKCGCGRKGCWEAYASVTALIRQTKLAMEKDKNSLMHKIAEGDGGVVSGKTSFVAAKKGDKTALSVVDNYIHHVATGLTNLINIFQPDQIVIGGAISKEGDYLLTPLKEYTFSAAYGHGLVKKPIIKTASLGNDAGIIGAALLGKINGVE